MSTQPTQPSRPTVIQVTQEPYRSRVHESQRSRSPLRPPGVTIIPQPSRSRSRVHEPQRSRSPTQPPPVSQVRFHEPQRSRSPPPVIVPHSYPRSRVHHIDEPRRSRSPRPPVIIQQPYGGSRVYHSDEPRRSRSPSPQAYHTHSRSRVHERHHIRSPSPVVIQQPYSGSRVYERYHSRSPTPVVIQLPYDGPRVYERQHSQPAPPVIIQQPHNGSWDYDRRRSRSPSPVHVRSYHDRSRQSYREPTVIVVPGSRTPSPAPHYAAQYPPSFSRGTDRDEYDHDQQVYTAVDPFRPSVASSINFAPSYYDTDPHSYYYQSHYPQSQAAYPVKRRTAWKTLLADSLKLFLKFFFDTLPSQIYLYFLLRLPAFYFSRVALIFNEADMTMSEIKGMAVATLLPMTGPTAIHDWDHTISALNSKLKTTWEAFIDSLLREWKTLNIVSVLLLSAILTILQIQSAADDPIARHAALLSLVCALMSLLYGCMYIIRFGGMRKAYKAAEWAAEGQKTKTLIWWNVWVLLAMPAIWLAWSIILYIVCIMAFVWRAGTTDPPYSPLSRHAALGPRIAISGVLGLGLIYFLLVLNTFRRYGDIMDKNWTDRVAGWTREKISDEKRRHAYQNESQRTRNRSPSYSPTAYDPSIYPHIPNSPNLTRTQFAQPYDRFTPRSPVLNMNGFPLTQNMQSYPSAPSMQGYPPAQSMQAPLPVPIHVPPTPFMRRRSRSRSVSRVQRSEASRDRPPPPQVPWPSNEIYWSNPDYNPIMAPAHSTIIIPSSVFFNTLKVMDLRFLSRTSNPMPDVLFGRGIYVKDWTQFISDASHEWTGEVPLYLWDSAPSGEIVRPQDAVAEVVERWNSEFFNPRGTRAFLCYEYMPGYPYSSGFAIYLADWLSSGSQPPDLEGRFESVMEGLEQIDIYDPPFDTSRMTFGKLSVFSKRHRVRGRVDVGISIKRRTDPVPFARPSSPLTTIPEVTERSRSSRSRRSRRFTTAEIPVSARTHPEMVSPPASRSSSRSSERRSRWSRSPSHIERIVPSGGEASDTHRVEPSNPSSPAGPTSPTISPVDGPRQQSHDADIQRWVQSQAMSTADGIQPGQQPVVYVSSASDVRSTDRHHTIVDQELQPHPDDRSRHHRGRLPVIYARTDPRVSRHAPSSSRRRSTSPPSRHSHRHHSIPVGYSTHLPSDFSSRKSTALMASDQQRTHRSKPTHSSLPYAMSYHGEQAYPHLGTPSPNSGPPPPVFPHTMSYQEEQPYPDSNGIEIPFMSSGPLPPALPHTMSSHGEQAYPTLNEVGIPSTRSGPPPPTQPITTESQSIDRDGTSSHRMPYPPLLSPLPLKPMSIDFEEGFNQNDVGVGDQHSPRRQPQIGQSSSEHELGPAGVIEGPWKRDIDSLQIILRN